MAEQRETTILDVKLDVGKVEQDLTAVIQRINALKAEQQQLNSAIKAGNDVNGENSKRLREVKDELTWAERSAKALTATTKLLTSDSKTYDDTLNGQRQKLTDLQRAYAELSAEQRDSSGGEAFRKAIKEQHDAVLELEQGIGLSQRNVGNYPKILGGVIPSFGGLTDKVKSATNAFNEMGGTAPNAFKAVATSIGSATKAALTFIATPIGAMITAVVVVAQKLSEAFKRNDDAGTALARLFASFKPILTIVNQAFDALALVIGNVANAISDVIAMFSDEAKAAQGVVTATDELEETERKYAVNSAKRNRDISKLRAEAAESRDLKVRREKLEQAIKLEEQNLADERNIARTRLSLLERSAKKEVDTSDAIKNKIADARAALFSAEQKYFDGTRRMRSELANIESKSVATVQRASDNRIKILEDEARKRADLLARQTKDEQDILRMAEDFTISQIEDEGERKREQRRVQGERELQELQERLNHANDAEVQMTEAAQFELAELIREKRRALQEELFQMDEEHAREEAQAERDRAIYIAEQRAEAVDAMRDGFKEQEVEKENERWEAQKELWDLQMEDELAHIDLSEEQKLALKAKWQEVMEAAERDHQEALIQIEKRADAVKLKEKLATAKAAQGFLSTLSSSLAEYGEQSKAAAVASKVMALGEIAVNTGTAIAKGISQAQSVPFPANIAAIATTVTTIMANIFSAIKTVNSAKFSAGGVVDGGTYQQGDIVPAMLSPQEVVLNPTQTAQTLFAIANGAQLGGGTDNLAEVVVAAVSAMPAPVMDYTEFKTFESRVATYNEIARV